MSSTSYRQTLDYLFSQLPMYQRVGHSAFKKDLTNTIKLCEAAGNPHHKLKCIHVAGTNGKGSVSHIIAAALQQQGYKVGLYTSPHYKDFRERIKINGAYISEDNVIGFVERYKNAFETIKPSFFEMTVVMAFDYFANQKVDYAIIEVGLGGRFDSTNVITPVLSVITNIGYDHIDMLGNTLSEIAFEKAGIIKRNVPVIIGETHPETKGVFIKKAESEHAFIVFADYVNIIKGTEIKNNVQKIVFQNRTFETDLLGHYQAMNIATSLTALEYLNEHQIITINNNAVQKGIGNVRSTAGLIGRFQIVSKQPLVIFDSAHNESGLSVLLKQIESIEHKQLHIVMGTVNDKDLSKVFPLLPGKATYYFCKADIPRGLNAASLKEKAADYQLKGNYYSSVQEAYETAIRIALPDDLVLVTGSIFVVAEII